MSKGPWNTYKSKDNTKKTNFVGIKVSDTEKQKLEQLAEDCNLKLSEFILSSSLYSNTLSVIANRDELKELRDQLRKIGVNVNQAIHKLNYLVNASPCKYEQIINSVVELQQQQLQLSEAILKIRYLLDNMKRV